MATYETSRRRRRSSYDVVPGVAAPGWLTWRRGLAIAAGLAVLVVGAYGARVVLGVARLFHTDPISAVRTIVGGHGSSPIAQDARDLKRINIALYGYGGPGHDGPYLTDSIMVVSIQPRPSGPPAVAEISIPRDWYVPIDLGGGRTAMGRVNEAYSAGQTGAPFQAQASGTDHGGGAVADATLARMLGIHIDYFVGLDFTAFRDAVDALGGVDVDVQRSFTDDNYPHGECPPDCAVMTVHFDAGMQHMDGDRALIFARSRESSDPQEGSNFARNKRQQLVLSAIKSRVLSAGGIGNLPDLLTALGDHVTMDLGLDDSLALYDLLKDVDQSSIVHISLDDTNFLYECDYPRACTAALELPHDHTFASVSRYVTSLFVPPDALGERAQVRVVDASGTRVGADRRWAGLLAPLGLTATAAGTSRTSATTHVYDASGGGGGRTAAWLAAYYGVPVEPGPPPPSPGGAGAAAVPGITVVLGQDEERAFARPDAGLYR